MKNKNEQISNRIWVVFSLLAIFGLAIMGKVFKIQIVEKEKWKDLGKTIVNRELSNPSPRGEILATDGTILAVTVPTYTLYWDTQSEAFDLEKFVENMDTIAGFFAKEFYPKSKQGTLDEEVFNRTKKEFISIFNQGIKTKSRYHLIKKKLNFINKENIKNFALLPKGRYKSGFIFEKKMTRTKLFENLASRTVGSIYAANLKGQHGLELAYEKELAGVAGKQLKTLIPGATWKPVSNDYIIEPIAGLDLVSSIDIHLQDLTQTALLQKLNESQADWGVAALMEVETGYIRAISNFKRGDSSYYEGENLAVNALYDPGSTFKLPVMMSVIEDGLMTENDSIDTGKGYAVYYDKSIEDTHGYGKGTLSDIFAWSSNVGMAKMIDKCYKEDKQKFLDRLNSFGLGQPLNIEIPGKRAPVLYQATGHKSWSLPSHVQLAIGYELNQTPLQILTFYNAVANGGKMMKPLFAESLLKNRKVEKKFPPVTMNKRIASTNTIDVAHNMLIKACHDKKGTAYHVFKKSPYQVAGKTGTARLFIDNQYYKDKHRASFVGYFPAENPKYTCIVVIHNPRIGSHYGAGAAAPVFKEIADQIFNSQIDQSEIISGLEYQENRKIPVSLNGDYERLQVLYKTLGITMKNKVDAQYARVSTQKDGIEVGTMNFNSGIMPNLKDMSVQDAIYLLENLGLEVEIKGIGRIKKQSIKQGTKLKGKGKIILELA